MSDDLEADLRQVIQARMLGGDADREDVVGALRSIANDLDETEVLDA